MLRRIRFPAALLALLGLAAVSLPVPASAASALSAEQKAAMEALIHDYILDHPDVVVEALNKMQEREHQAQLAAQKQLLVANRQSLLNDPTAPVAGNPKGDITLVEFFDYQCGYCRAFAPDLDQVLRSDDKLRVVYKEFPVLGPASVVASRAALAAARQGKYLAMHDALLALRGQLDDATIMRVASSVGLDVARLKADMASPEISKIIAGNLRLAETLQITGTPSLILGDHLIPGAVPLDQLVEMLHSARAG